MLKSNVGYSVEIQEKIAGQQAATMAIKNMKNPKFGLLYTDVKSDHETIIDGIKEITGDISIIGCNSIGSLIVPEGIIGNENKFCGLMLLEDDELKVGIAQSQEQENPRVIAHKLALEAMENAGMGCAPDYIYMVSSTKYEEDYVRGIEDVVGRVPLFGGGIKENEGSIFTDIETLQNGVAVAFIYTKKKVVTEFIGPYEETKNSGIITALDGKRTLLEIDGEPSLKKYAKWVGKELDELMGEKVQEVSVDFPLGVKDCYGECTAIRYITKGNPDYSMNVSNDLALNTAITCMKKVPEQFTEFSKNTLLKTKEQLKEQVGAYLLIQSGSYKLDQDKTMEDLYHNIKEVTNGVPFIMVFTYGEYGYTNHSANICGELMLSFTGFSKE